MLVTGSILSPASEPSNRALRTSESRRPATRSLSRITEDDSHDEGGTETNATPRQSTHRRQASMASGRASRRSKSHTALSMTERGSDQNTPRVKRAKIRPSLAGPQVHEMNIETRAQILIPIAEDCIVQLLRAGLNGTIYRRNVDQSWRLAWDSLQSQRRNKLFSPDSLPFNDFEDVREAFHSSVRARINTASLERAIHLSNLATFLWVILQPDAAHTLLGGKEERSQASTRSNRRLEALEDENNLDIRDIVSRRNRVFGMAWKRYWKDVIPQSMRGNKHAIQLWARLSVQIMMIFRLSTIDGKPNATRETDLPQPDPEVVAELFSASAIAQYGQWTTDMPSARDAEIKENAQRRWTDMAKQRRIELREFRQDVLVERYPYDEFRRDMLAFIDEAVLHTLISHSVSPRKPALDELDSSASTSEHEDEDASRGDKEGEVDEEADTTIRPVEALDDADAERSLSNAEPQSDSESDREPEADLDLDLDILDQILHEMTPEELGLAVEDQEDDELETDENDFPSDLDSVSEDRNATPQAPTEQQDEPETDENDFPSDLDSGGEDQDATPQPAVDEDELEEVDDDVTVQMDQEQLEPAQTAQQNEELETDSDDFPSDLNSGDENEEQEVEQDGQSEAGWAVKDAPVAHTRTRKTERNFEFAARQISAEQVGWDSQSLPQALRRTARTPLFLPHQDSESATFRSASATPRPQHRGPSEVRPTHTGQSPLDRPLNRDRQEGSANIDDMMPSSSVLGTPRQVGQIRERKHAAELAPSPMRRDQSAETERGIADEGTQEGAPQADGHDSAGGDGELRSNSPSPQRPSTDRVGVDMLQEPDPVVPSSSRTKPTNDNRLAARSQRVLVDPRKRRRVDADFASVSSSDQDDENDRLNQHLPPIHAPSSPRPSIRRRHTPLGEIPQNLLKQSPRSPIGHRDFIIVPKIIRPAPVSEPAAGPETDDKDQVEPNTDSQQSHRSLSRTEYDDDELESEIRSQGSRRSTSREPVVGFQRFLLEDDGSPLETDPAYTIPTGHKPKPSVLHGRVGKQATIYSRMAGVRKWTDEEQVLLYRTVQKVPLDEQYPLRVVWYLHGEYGTLSNDLEDFNTQHMKDKMKTIVHARYNNRRPIEGRARYWLPPVPAADGHGSIPHPDKVELEGKIARAVRKRKDREREIARVKGEEALRLKEEEAKRKKVERAEKADKAKRGKKRPAKVEDDELDSDDADGDDDQDDNEDEDENENAEKDAEQNAEEYAQGDGEEGEEELSDPGPSTRSRRSTRATQARKDKSRPAARPKRGRATKAAAAITAPETNVDDPPEAQDDPAHEPNVEQVPYAGAEQIQEMDDEHAQRSDEEPPSDAVHETSRLKQSVRGPVAERPSRRLQLEVLIKIPKSRASSKAPQIPDQPDLNSDTAAVTTQPGLGANPQESMETIYEAPSSGKMMKRTRQPEPVVASEDESESNVESDEHESESNVESDEHESESNVESDDDEEDDDATPTGDETHGDDALPEVAGSIQEPLENGITGSGQEGEDNETDKNAEEIARYIVLQKVMGGLES